MQTHIQRWLGRIILIGVLIFIPASALAAGLSLSGLTEIFVSLKIIAQDKALAARDFVASYESGALQCVTLTKNLYRGLSDNQTGGEVSGLQRFLTLTGDFAVEITGFFGPITEQAVKDWQARNGVVSSGSPETTGWGVVGPATRTQMAAACLPGTPPEVVYSSCTLDGLTVAHGESAQFYSASSVPFGSTCDSIAQVRACVDSALLGDTAYSKSSCVVAPPQAPWASGTMRSVAQPAGPACQIDNARAEGGGEAGLARINSTTVVAFDGVQVSSCFDVDFGSTEYREIKVGYRMLNTICGDSCEGQYCGTFPSLSVFTGTDGSSWKSASGLSSSTTSVQQILGPFPSFRYVRVCRGSGSAVRGNIAVDHVLARKDPPTLPPATTTPPTEPPATTTPPAETPASLNLLGFLTEREGWGNQTTGGSDGAIFHVTTLADGIPAPAGSLREALTKDEALWIIFDVSGTIRVTAPPIFSKSNKTIDGRGKSITLSPTTAGGPVLRFYDASNIIVTNLLFNGEWPNWQADAEGGDLITMSNAERIWIHHNRFQQSSDGAIDMTGPASRNVSVTWNFFYRIYQALNFNSGSVSFGHNRCKEVGFRCIKIRENGKGHSYNNLITNWMNPRVQVADDNGQLYTSYNMFVSGSERRLGETVVNGKLRMENNHAFNTVEFIGGNDSVDSTFITQSRSKAKMNTCGGSDTNCWNALKSELETKTGPH